MASKEEFWKNYRAMRNEERNGGSRWTVVERIFASRSASALGEQSDRAEIISADGAIWDETAPGTRNFKRREQSE